MLEDLYGQVGVYVCVCMRMCKYVCVWLCVAVCMCVSVQFFIRRVLGFVYQIVKTLILKSLFY